MKKLSLALVALLFIVSTAFGQSARNPAPISDGNGAGLVDVVGSSPSGSEQGLVTRNIPSGTQTVSGSVTCSNCSGTGVSVNEDVASANADPGTPAYSVRQDTPSSTTSTDGDYQPLKSNNIGRLYTSSTIDAALPTGTNNIGDVDVLSVVPGTGATALGKAADSAAGSTDTGVAALCIRDDAVATLTPVDGDYTHCRTNARGALWVDLETRLDSANDSVLAVGGAAHDAAVSGNPVLEGGYASAAAPTDVSADGDMVRGWRLRNGAAAMVLTAGGALIGGDATNGIDVDVTRLPALPTGSNVIGALSANQSVNVAQINGVTPLMGAGNTGTGSHRVTIATDQAALTGLGVYVEDAGETAGGNLSMAGAVRRDTATSSSGTDGDNSTINTNNVGAVWTTQVPATNGGTLSCPVQSAASTNATNCKNAAGQIYNIQAVNTTSTIYFLRLYNLSSAPTCSSATGFIRTIPIPHGTGTGAGIAIDQSVGEAFSTGIGFCLTGGGSSTDNTNAATGVYVTILYK